MERFELIAPCHFGLEAVMKREILDLGYEVSQVEDGRVTFIGDAEAVCRANIFLRTTERILLKVGSFKAETFEELFQGTRAIPWEQYIPRDGKFWVEMCIRDRPSGGRLRHQSASAVHVCGQSLPGRRLRAFYAKDPG